jgi:hypothetical protein
MDLAGALIVAVKLVNRYQSTVDIGQLTMNLMLNVD